MPHWYLEAAHQGALPEELCYLVELELELAVLVGPLELSGAESPAGEAATKRRAAWQAPGGKLELLVVAGQPQL